MGKIIQNQMIEIQLVLHQLTDARNILKESLKKRKEMAIQQGDTQWKEPYIARLFNDGKSSEYDEAIVDLREKKNAPNEEVINLKREHEIQVVRLREEIIEEDRITINED